MQAPHPAEGTLRNLVKELKKSESSLPETVLKMIEETSLQQQQEDTKWLHSAVAKMGHAKKTLQAACTARSSFHQKWNTFLSESVERWQAYVKEFTDRDQEMEAQIARAQENLAAAKTALEETKTKVANNDILMEEDDDLDERPDPGINLRNNLEGMMISLESIKNKATAALEEQASKKLKLAEPTRVINLEEGKEADGSKASSLEPFGRPGQ